MAPVSELIQPPALPTAESSASKYRAMGKQAPRLLIVVATLGVLITAGLILWNNVLKSHFVVNNFGVVEPGRIYRSGQISRHLIRQTLEQKHIGLIVDLSKENSDDARAEEQIAADLGVKHLTLHLGGNGTGDSRLYPQAIKAIVQANQHNTPVLVHCQAGSQRTGGVIAAYRILIEGESEADAFAEARRYGHDPDRNPKLIPFVEQHLPEWKQQLADDHVLPAK